MKEKAAPYTFAVLRYVHDVVTEEFINVGVLVYSPQMKFSKILCAHSFSRLSSAFSSVNGLHYRSVIRRIEEATSELEEHVISGVKSELAPDSIQNLLGTILPKDDSSLRFSTLKGGISADLEQTLSSLYARYVELYSQKEARPPKRSDQQVLTMFKEPLVRRHLTEVLRPKTIEAPKYRHEFPWSWENGKWNVCEAVSFDLLDPDYIIEKANTWIGRAKCLSEARLDFKLYLLLGEPQTRQLRSQFKRARSILEDLIDSDKAVYSEAEATDFVEQVQRDLSIQ